MEMNAQEKCDVNHFGYCLRALEAWKILFSPSVVSLRIFPPVSSRCYRPYISYILCCETYSTINNNGRDFYFFHIRKEESKLKKNHPSQPWSGKLFPREHVSILWDG